MLHSARRAAEDGTILTVRDRMSSLVGAAVRRGALNSDRGKTGPDAEVCSGRL